jgi:hypothetical protein
MTALSQRRFDLYPVLNATYSNLPTETDYFEVSISGAVVEIDEMGLIRGRIEVRVNDKHIRIVESRSIPTTPWRITAPIRTLVVLGSSDVKIAGARFADKTTISATSVHNGFRSVVQLTSAKKFDMLHLIVNGAVDFDFCNSSVHVQSFIHFDGCRQARLNRLAACKNTEIVVLGDAIINVGSLAVSTPASPIRSGSVSPAPEEQKQQQQPAAPSPPRVTEAQKQVVIEDHSSSRVDFDYGDDDDELVAGERPQKQQRTVIDEPVHVESASEPQIVFKSGRQGVYMHGRGQAGPPHHRNDRFHPIANEPYFTRGSYRGRRPFRSAHQQQQHSSNNQEFVGRKVLPPRRVTGPPPTIDLSLRDVTL